MFFRKRRTIKRGFTLIELIVVLGILSVVTFLFKPSLKIYSDKKAEIEMNYALEGIIEIINLGKSYGRLTGGTILIKFMSREVAIYHGTKEIEKFIIPDSIRGVYLSDGIKSIEINPFGLVKKAKSIELRGYSGINKTITVKVGTSYVSEKK